MAKWSKQSLRMKETHGWRAKPGYQILVLDRGAVRFDFPRDWHFEPGPMPVTLHDKKPPDDQCRLQLSLFRTPPGIDWSALPLPQLLADAMKDDEPDPEVIERGEIVHVERRDLELAWRQTRRIDPNEKREARSRSRLARGSDLHVLITLDFWPEDAKRLEPVWDEVLRSLRLGQYVADPTVGPPVMH